ncbi:MAG: hypothetical protein IJ930_00275 [Lachnospiraceae bacterium]|nr:hypothetical protein [Lachnospiraceae bacterium]
MEKSCSITPWRKPQDLDGVTGVYRTQQGYYMKDSEVEEFDKGFRPSGN